MKLVISLFIFGISAFANANANTKSNGEYISAESFENERSHWKALVFLSQACPCSRSHIEHLNQLQEKYPDLKIYGVISEPPQDEVQKKDVDKYFKSTVFKFPIVADEKQTLVKKYGALKTPHLTLFEKDGKGVYQLIYQGGVTNQKDFEKSEVKYFAENMDQLSQGKPLKYKNGQSLGCYIRRL